MDSRRSGRAGGAGAVEDVYRFAARHQLYPALPILLSTALLNAWVAPHLQVVAAADVFWATLTWSLGVAASTANLLHARNGRVGSWSVSLGMLLSLFGAAYLATQIGLGAYSTSGPTTGSALTEFEAFAYAGTQAWGLLGAALGAISGVLAGRCAYEYLARA